MSLLESIKEEYNKKIKEIEEKGSKEIEKIEQNLQVDNKEKKRRKKEIEHDTKDKIMKMNKELQEIIKNAKKEEEILEKGLLKYKHNRSNTSIYLHQRGKMNEKWYKSSRKNKKKYNRKKTIKGGLCLRDIGLLIPCYIEDYEKYLVKTRTIVWGHLYSFLNKNLKDEGLQEMEIFKNVFSYIMSIVFKTTSCFLGGVVLSSLSHTIGNMITAVTATISAVYAREIAKKYSTFRSGLITNKIMLPCAGPFVPFAIIIAFFYRYPHRMCEIMDIPYQSIAHIAQVQGVNTATRSIINVFSTHDFFYLNDLDKFVKVNGLPTWPADVFGIGNETVQNIHHLITDFITV